MSADEREAVASSPGQPDSFGAALNGRKAFHDAECNARSTLRRDADELCPLTSAAQPNPLINVQTFDPAHTSETSSRSKALRSPPEGMWSAGLYFHIERTPWPSRGMIYVGS